MARKMKSVSLAEAWLEFWPVLFPDSPDWKTTLEGWVRTNLLHFDPAEFLRSELDLVVSRPRASSLFIDAERLGARVSIGDRQLDTAPWFASTLIEHSPQWKDQHPIDRLLEWEACGDATALHRESECARIVRNVTLRAGAKIKSVLANALREGRLTATGLSATDGLRARRKVSAEQLKAMVGLDVLNNRVEFRMGVPPIDGVKVARNPDFKDDKRRGGSFADADAELIEEMHRRRISDPTLSVLAAARLVLPKAQRRADAEDESVIERLRRAYGRCYPRGNGGSVS